MTARPAHADPTLWDHPFMWGVGIIAPHGDHPIAHRLVAGPPGRKVAACTNKMIHKRWWVRNKYAAQFALPCLRCWPDAREGREQTIEARKAAA